MEGLADFTRSAVVPEQLAHYVRAVGGFSPLRVGPFLAWRRAGSLVLVAYPREGGRCTQAEVDGAVEAALGLSWLGSMAVLSPFRPSALPQDALCVEDEYWTLDLPLSRVRPKLANMLRRAGALTEVDSGPEWTAEHEALLASCTAEMLKRPGERRLSEASARLFSRVGAYVRESGGKALCYSARRRDDGRLCALAVADHAAYATSFYLFAFRAPDAPPGSADGLLKAILDKSEALGQRRCNLGLGSHAGIRFFKSKWGAGLGSRMVDCSWEPRRPFSLLRALFGRRAVR